MPEPENKQPDNFNLHIKNKIINYGIITVLIFIALTVGVKYYLVKTRCDRMQNYIFINGQCVFDYKRAPVHDFTVKPTTPIAPTPQEQKQQIYYYFVNQDGSKKLMMTSEDYNPPSIYSHYLLVTPQSTEKVFDLNTGEQVDFFSMFHPQSIDKLKSAFTAQEQKRNGPYYGGLYEIDDYVFFTFGAYLSDGGLVRLNTITGEVYEYPEEIHNPRIEKIGKSNYVFGGEGDACWSFSEIRRLDRNLKLSQEYELNAECEKGEYLHYYPPKEQGIIFEYFAKDMDETMFGTQYITKLYTFDLTNFNKKLLIDLTKYHPDGLYQLSSHDYNGKRIYLFSDPKNNLYLFNQETLKLMPIQNVQTSTEIDNQMIPVNFKEEFICIQPQGESKGFTVIDLQGEIPENVEPNSFCSIREQSPSMSAKEARRIQLQAVADKFTQGELPKNILIEVKED